MILEYLRKIFGPRSARLTPSERVDHVAEKNKFTSEGAPLPKEPDGTCVQETPLERS